jgi:CCR4-NOT transcription complex subunit 1
MLYLFAKSNELVQESIARVLLERLISSRPYPWGLLITFSELVKNASYGFASKSFINVAPEIKRLYESVESHIRGAK